VSVAGIGHQGTGWAGWHRVITVDNGAGPYTHSERVGTVAVGIAKKIFFESGRSAYKTTRMVVKLVGQ